MDVKIISLYLFILVLFFVIPEGTSLKCFACHSHLEGPCAVNPTDVNVEDCKEDNPRCYLVTQTKENPKFVQRGCTSGPQCPKMPWGNECTLCDNKDTCNDLVFKIPNDNSNNNNNGNGNDNSKATSSFNISLTLLIVNISYLILKPNFSRI